MPPSECLPINPRPRFVCCLLVFVLAWQSAFFPALAATLLDADGRAVQSTDALGRFSKPTYDNGGRVTQSALFDRTGKTLSTGSTHYDALGRVDYSTDASGHQKRMVYDALGRLSAVIQATQGVPTNDGSGAYDLVTHFGYDEVGHKIWQQDANGRMTRFGYDVRGRMIWRALPLGQVEGMSYNAGGQMLSLTDFRGFVTTCSYDLRGRLLAKVPDARLREATLTYAYPDENTRIAYRGASVTKQSYDPQRGWLNSVSGPNGSVSYSYNPEGQKLAMTAPSGTTGYGYDVMGRLSAINDQPTGATSATSIASYAYDAVGNLSTLTRGNGVQTRYAYDEQNRLSDLVNTANAGDLSRFHYTLRGDGKRTTIGENVVDAPDATTGAARSSVRSLAYTYDNAGKLTGETGQDGNGLAYANTWNYDAVGNRISATVQKAATAGATTWAHTTSVSAVFNANDQLTSQSSSVDGGAAVAQNFAYDANGAEAGTSTASGTSTNGWDFEGKLTQTALADSSGNAAGGSANVFDAAGDRLSHTDSLGKTGQKTTSYLVDTDTSYSQVIEERAPDVSDAAGNPTLQARYVWGGGLAPLAMWRKMPDGSVKLFFHLSDGQESVRQLTDASGAVADSYFYDAWGNTLDGSSHNVANPFRYTGQQLDADGRYYLRDRFYNPGTGRFLSHDPLMGDDDDPASLHRYLYAGGDGVNACDPSGKDPNFLLAGLATSMGIGATLGGLQAGLTSYAQTGKLQIRAIAEGAAWGALTGAAMYLGGWWLSGTKFAPLLIKAAPYLKGLSAVAGGVSFGSSSYLLVQVETDPNASEGQRRAAEALWVASLAMVISMRPGASQCFTAGTLVPIKGGRYIPIERIKVGDSVLSRDVVTGETSYKKVKVLYRHISRNMARVRFDRGDKILSTEDHPYYVTSVASFGAALPKELQN